MGCMEGKVYRRVPSAVLCLCLIAAYSTAGDQTDKASWRLPVFQAGQPLPGSTPRYSPDGKWIAFTAHRAGANDIAVVPASGGEAVRLTTTSRSLHPAWSPDGSKIVFASFGTGGSSGIFVIPASGGTPEPVTSGPGIKLEPDWSPDGRLIVYASGVGGNWNLWTVPATGGEPKRLTEHKGDEWSPRWSPDGKWIFFVTNWSVNGDINDWKIPSSGGEPIQITALPSDEVTPAPSPDGGRIAYYTDTGGLWVMDLATKKTINVARGEGFRDIISWSPDGKRLAVGYNPQPAVLKKIALNGTALEQRVAGRGSIHSPDISPDGKSIVFRTIDREGNPDLWKVLLRGGSRGRITTHPAIDRDPAWSPDGRWISFSSDREGSRGGDIWKVLVSGREPQRLTSLTIARFPRWCRAGAEIVFQHGRSADENPHIWSVPAAGGTPRQITTGVLEMEPDCHGTQLAYSGQVAKGAEIFVHDLTTGHQRQLTSDGARARKPRWSADGSRIAFLSNKEGSWEIYSILITTGSASRLTSDGGSKSAPSWAPDGQSLLYSVQAGESEIWIFRAP